MDDDRKKPPRKTGARPNAGKPRDRSGPPGGKSGDQVNAVKTPFGVGSLLLIAKWYSICVCLPVPADPA